MKVSELYAPHGPFVGQDLYVVGTGASMRFFPVKELESKLCLLLNDGTRWFPTLGPIVFCNNRNQAKFASDRIRYRIGKGRLKFDPNPERDDNHISWDDPDWHVFSYKEQPWEPLSHHDERTIGADPLYYWAPEGGSVSAFAIQFALYAGVRSITLVGCDCCAVNGEHYAPGKKTHHSHDYGQYTAGLLRMRREANKRGVPLTSWTPFLGLRGIEDQYREMQRWPSTCS